MNHNNSGCTSGNIPTNNNDVIPPLVIIIAHSSRYKALFVTLLAFIFMCFFLVADNTLGWGFPIFFGLETLFTGYLAVKYWRIGNTPVVQFNGHLMFVRDLAKPIPIEKIVAFDYRQDIKGTLIFKLTCDVSDFLIKRRFADLMLLKRKDFFELRLDVLIGRFSILGKNLKVPAVKQLISDYIKERISNHPS